MASNGSITMVRFCVSTPYGLVAVIPTTCAPTAASEGVPLMVAPFRLNPDGRPVAVHVTVGVAAAVNAWVNAELCMPLRVGALLINGGLAVTVSVSALLSVPRALEAERKIVFVPMSAVTGVPEI